MNSFTHYISLGSNCAVRSYIDHFRKSTTETQFFDYIGTSIWSIIELLKDDFNDFYSRHLIEKMEIRIGRYIYTNKKYYVRILHDLDHTNDNITDKNYNEFVEKYKRRKQRLYNILNTPDNKVLFIRTEEDSDRIIHPDYKEKFLKTENEYLKEFSELLHKMFPILNYAILHINQHNKLTSDIDNRIISIPQCEKIDWTNAPRVIEKTINNHKEYILVQLQLIKKYNIF